MKHPLHMAVVIAGAAAGGVAGPVPADVATPGGKVIDCYCTDTSGARVELGQEICLVVDGRAFMAKCHMSLNVPIWRDTGRRCVSSQMRRPAAPHPVIPVPPGSRG